MRIAEKLGLPNPKGLVEASKRQGKLIELQVEQIVIQTQLMERWANAMERIADSLEKIGGEFFPEGEIKHDHKAGKEAADLHGKTASGVQ